MNLTVSTNKQAQACEGHFTLKQQQNALTPSSLPAMYLWYVFALWLLQGFVELILKFFLSDDNFNHIPKLCTFQQLPPVYVLDVTI